MLFSSSHFFIVHRVLIVIDRYICATTIRLETLESEHGRWSVGAGEPGRGWCVTIYVMWRWLRWVMKRRCNVAGCCCIVAGIFVMVIVVICHERLLLVFFGPAVDCHFCYRDCLICSFLCLVAHEELPRYCRTGLPLHLVKNGWICTAPVRRVRLGLVIQSRAISEPMERL